MAARSSAWQLAAAAASVSASCTGTSSSTSVLSTRRRRPCCVAAAALARCSLRCCTHPAPISQRYAAGAGAPSASTRRSPSSHMAMTAASAVDAFSPPSQMDSRSECKLSVPAPSSRAPSSNSGRCSGGEGVDGSAAASSRPTARATTTRPSCCTTTVPRALTSRGAVLTSLPTPLISGSQGAAGRGALPQALGTPPSAPSTSSTLCVSRACATTCSAAVASPPTEQATAAAACRATTSAKAVCATKTRWSRASRSSAVAPCSAAYAPNSAAHCRPACDASSRPQPPSLPPHAPSSAGNGAPPTQPGATTHVLRRSPTGALPCGLRRAMAASSSA
mmetsp:Transcript_7748/g.23662  ORF Transcript_7748/g.23662 Transcript_7748/m.23662 type:complete len:335 (+) Transcript_7748:3948-4952(+)